MVPKDSMKKKSSKIENAKALGEEVGQLFKSNAPVNANTAAKIILNNIKKKNKRILVGADAHWYDRIQRLFPKKYIYFLPFVSLIRGWFPKDKPLDR